jgi:hypothetical protein
VSIEQKLLVLCPRRQPEQCIGCAACLEQHAGCQTQDTAP